MQLNKIEVNYKIKLLLFYLIVMVIIIMYNKVLDLGGHYISMCVWYVLIYTGCDGY
jgi:hypothetical protein